MLLRSCPFFEPTFYTYFTCIISTTPKSTLWGRGHPHLTDEVTESERRWGASLRSPNQEVAEWPLGGSARSSRGSKTGSDVELQGLCGLQNITWFFPVIQLHVPVAPLRYPVHGAASCMRLLWESLTQGSAWWKVKCKESSSWKGEKKHFGGTDDLTGAKHLLHVKFTWECQG